MHRRLAAPLAAITVGVSALALAPASAAQAAPSAPRNCETTVSAGGYLVTWDRPTNDGGAAVWRYSVREVGRRDSLLRLDSAGTSRPNPARAILWSSATTTAEPQFQVRGVNQFGRSEWCVTAKPLASTPTPEPSPEPAPEPQPVGLTGTWKLAFNDDFGGTTLSNRWASSWFNGSRQNNVSTSPNNVKLVDGDLVLTLASSSSGASVNTNPNDAASNPFELTYGYAEARIRFPGNSSGALYNWPAWWINGQNWPATGENDIAEVLGGHMTVNYHSGSGIHNQGVVPGNWANAYHTYGIDRRPGRVDVYYDGMKVKSYATDDGGAPHYLLLNVGQGQGSPTVTGAASQVRVDYVRVWKRS